MSKQIVLKANPENTMELLSDYIVKYTASVFDQHEKVTNSKIVKCEGYSHVFDAEAVVNNIQEFKILVNSKYTLEKPLNFYAIIRTATPKNVLIEELSKLPDFYKDKNLSNHNSIVRIGNLKNVVFYYCPVYSDLKKYHVDVGLKNGKEILIQASHRDGLAINLEFNREVVKDYRSRDNNKDFSKKFEDKTTEIIKNKDFPNVTKADLAKVPASVPVNMLTEHEKAMIGKPTAATVSVPISALPPEEVKTITKKNEQLFSHVLLHPYQPEWKKAHLPLEGTELKQEVISRTTEDLRNEFKKMEEQELLKEQKAEAKAISESYAYTDGFKLGVSTRDAFTDDRVANYHKDSKDLSELDYATKARAFGNVGKGANLPLAYVDKARGFYKREERETDNLILKSTESVLTYKLEKMLEFANSFKENAVYTKQEEQNLHVFKTTYVNHNFIHENKIPFILIKENESTTFNFYGNEVRDNQQIQEKTYTSLLDLVKDFREKAKDHLIFVKRVSPQEFVEALTPSWKSINEYKIKCYFLPKNQF